MFEASFIGHQGWIISTAHCRILIDPVLTAAFGHGGLAGRVFPPRDIDLERFPAVDAVVITHEHDDHFDLASLNLLDRKIPIHLSSRSSDAARRVLAAMGFRVCDLEPDATLEIGDLRYRTAVADHRSGKNGDEWDVFPFLVFDGEHDGSLLSAVDVQPSPEMLDMVKESGVHPGIWAVANNTTDVSFQDCEARAVVDGDDTEALATIMGRRYEALQRAFGAPAMTIVCGAGWSYPEAQAWIDHWAFSTDAASLCAALGERHPKASFLDGIPGRSVAMVGGRVRGVREELPYLRARPGTQWPDRRYTKATARADYGPACGRRACPSAEVDELIERLADFARHLYGTEFFRQLHSLSSKDIERRHPGLCFSLRSGEGGSTLVLRYNPNRCGFEHVEIEDARTKFASGIECWASDLLALCRGEIGPTALCYAGRLRVWNAAPRKLRASPHLLWMWSHPLRRPEAAAALYERVVAELPVATPRIPFRG